MPSEDSLANMNFKLVVFYGLISYVSAIEPVSAFGAIGTAFVAGLYTAYTPIKCHFNECCTSKWINLNTTGSLKFLFTDEIVYKVKDNFFHFYKSDDHFYENCTSYGTWFVRMNHLLKVLSPYRRIPCICYTLCPQLVFLSIFIDNTQNCLRCAMSMKGIIKIQYLGFFHCLNTCSCALCIVDFCQGSPKM